LANNCTETEFVCVLLTKRLHCFCKRRNCFIWRGM